MVHQTPRFAAVVLQDRPLVQSRLPAEFEPLGKVPEVVGFVSFPLESATPGEFALVGQYTTEGECVPLAVRHLVQPASLLLLVPAAEEGQHLVLPEPGLQHQFSSLLDCSDCVDEPGQVLAPARELPAVPGELEQAQVALQEVKLERGVQLAEADRAELDGLGPALLGVVAPVHETAEVHAVLYPEHVAYFVSHHLDAAAQDRPLHRLVGLLPEEGGVEPRSRKNASPVLQRAQPEYVVPVVAVVQVHLRDGDEAVPVLADHGLQLLQDVAGVILHLFRVLVHPARHSQLADLSCLQHHRLRPLEKTLHVPPHRLDQLGIQLALHQWLDRDCPAFLAHQVMRLAQKGLVGLAVLVVAEEPVIGAGFGNGLEEGHEHGDDFFDEVGAAGQRTHCGLPRCLVRHFKIADLPVYHRSEYFNTQFNLWLRMIASLLRRQLLPKLIAPFSGKGFDKFKRDKGGQAHRQKELSPQEGKKQSSPKIEQPEQLQPQIERKNSQAQRMRKEVERVMQQLSKKKERTKKSNQQKSPKKPEPADDPQKQSDFEKYRKGLMEEWGKMNNKPNLKTILALWGAAALYYILADEIQDGQSISLVQLKRLLKQSQISRIQFLKVVGKQKEEASVIMRVSTKQNKNYHMEVLSAQSTMQKIGQWFPHGVDCDFEVVYSWRQSIFQKVLSMLILTTNAAIFFSVVANSGGSSKRMDSLFMGPQFNQKVKRYGVDTNVKVKFKDVAGLEEAKFQIVQFVDFLKNPLKYQALGARIPKGALLSGPPGTGKTMLAKACAGQAGVPFFYVSGSQFVELYVGMGAHRVRALFNAAKQKSPSIVFIDQIDAVGKKRQSSGGNQERQNTLNQLLVEMDGFSTDSNVIVLAATNRKELLDNALTRPGRFDRSIEVALPDLNGRTQVFLVHLAPLKLNPAKTLNQYAKRLATLTPGFSGADIANLCNEAAILAARNNKEFVEAIDFENASDRILAGSQKKRLVSEEERRTVAFHQSGHAVVSWFLEGAAPLLKLTIVPRSKGALGFAQYLPTQSTLQTKDELLDRICFILGGRCAEQQFFNTVTTGAYDDLSKAYSVARALVTSLGMSGMGYISYQENQYTKHFSNKTNHQIDQEVQRIIEECSQRTRAIIRERREAITNLASTLLEKETLDVSQIRKVLGERPFPLKENFRAYLEESTGQ